MTVSGTVSSETGEALSGVTVQMKGAANRGTTTGTDGRFSIRVPNEKAVLQFSMSGYKPREVAVVNNLDMNVVMNMSADNMSEVVVVGYGTQKKQTLTGAVAQIKSSEINTTKSTSDKMPPTSWSYLCRRKRENLIGWAGSSSIRRRTLVNLRHISCSLRRRFSKASRRRIGKQEKKTH